MTLRKLDDQEKIYLILEAKIETGKIVGIVRSSGGRFEPVKNDLTKFDLTFLADFD